MTYYECVFAPNAASRRDVFRVAQLVHDQGVSAYEAFTPQAFKGWSATTIPVLIDHDETREAGTVTPLSPCGDWWNASFVLDGPYAERAARLIERDGKVSPRFIPLDKDPDLAVPPTIHHTPTYLFTRAQLTELSLVSRGNTAWYAGAKVTRSYQPKEGLLVRETEPEGEVSYGYGQPIIRHGIGQVLRVR